MSSSYTLEAKGPGGAASGREPRPAEPAAPLRAVPKAGPMLEVRAPLSGVIVPLDSMPDPVFARRMAGDGVAIDPTSCEVLAPFDGVVTQLHDAHHALTVTSAEGVEVLVHVGLETVALRGRGFTALIAKGARVVRGQALLRFDPELVAREARSLLTAVLVTTPDRVARLFTAHGLIEAGAGKLLMLELAGAAVAAPAATLVSETALSEPVILINPEGLHARPAAVLAAEARRFTSDLRLVRGTDEANARSVVAVMGLSTRRGQAVRVRGSGADAREAVAALAHLLRGGCGEAPGEAPKTAPVLEQPAPRAPVCAGELSGAPAAPGLAIGRVRQHRRRALSVIEAGAGQQEERERLMTGIREVAAQLQALRQKADPFQAQMLGMHLTLLEDPDLADLAEGALRQGKSAPFAWQQAFSAHAARLERLENPLLRERAADVRDVGHRLLGLLAGSVEARLVLPEHSVLVAEEITPSEMASLDRKMLAAICTTAGSPTSHVAILARSMGVPAICGADEAILQLVDGDQVVVDGGRGIVRVQPDAEAVAKAEARIARDAARRESERSASFGEARTRDGKRVHVAANIGTLEDARAVVTAGGEGVGLLRSEFLFQDRATPPSEDEQAAIYGSIAATLGKERPLVIRTLDVGGDKPPAWLPLPREQNPFLGMRGIRVSFAWPDLFRAQLRAVLRAAASGNVQVMFPMVSGLDELRAARTFLAEEQARVPAAVEVGVMIEVPSAVMLAAELAREVDFFSIGTNDLAQYVLAMDRGHPKLARQADALHPAVLRMIDLTVRGARQHGKRVAVCGGLASDPLAVPLLVGLGVGELSVSLPSIPSVKAALSRWTQAECKALAAEVLGLGTTAEVRELLADQAEAHASTEG